MNAKLRNEIPSLHFCEDFENNCVQFFIFSGYLNTAHTFECSKTNGGGDTFRHF